MNTCHESFATFNQNFFYFFYIQPKSRIDIAQEIYVSRASAAFLVEYDDDCSNILDDDSLQLQQQLPILVMMTTIHRITMTMKM